MALCAGLLWLVPIMADAQLAGDLMKGRYGLASATQPAPGVQLTPWCYDSYSTTLVGANGHTVPTGKASTNELLLPALTFSVVAPWAFLGAHFGAQIWLWGALPSVDFPRLVTTKSTYNYGDMYLNPLQFGWHTTYVDVLIGYALWIPTGTYQAGALDNTGQGQWGYEFSAGTTIWFTKLHDFNFSVLALYDIYLTKVEPLTIGGKSSTLQTGQMLYLQGGLGYAFFGGLINVGIPYFVQIQTTDAMLPSGAGSALPGIEAARSWAIGLGAELGATLSPNDAINFRWVQGFAGANTTNGSSFFLSYTRTFFPFGERSGA